MSPAAKSSPKLPPAVLAVCAENIAPVLQDGADHMAAEAKLSELLAAARRGEMVGPEAVAAAREAVTLAVLRAEGAAEAETEAAAAAAVDARAALLVEGRDVLRRTFADASEAAKAAEAAVLELARASAAHSTAARSYAYQLAAHDEANKGLVRSGGSGGHVLSRREGVSGVSIAGERFEALAPGDAVAACLHRVDRAEPLVLSNSRRSLVRELPVPVLPNNPWA